MKIITTQAADGTERLRQGKVFYKMSVFRIVSNLLLRSRVIYCYADIRQ